MTDEEEVEEFCRVVIVTKSTPSTKTENKRVVTFSVQADGLHLVSVAGSETFGDGDLKADKFGCHWVRQGTEKRMDETRGLWEAQGEQVVFFEGVKSDEEHEFYLSRVEKVLWSKPLREEDLHGSHGLLCIFVLHEISGTRRAAPRTRHERRVSCGVGC